jgi:hypothetical protein
MKLSSLLGVFVIALGLGMQTPAAAEVVFNEKVPIEGTLLNLCTEEEVLLEGFAHILVKQDEQADGSIVTTTRTTFQVKGVGLVSGNRYVANETDRSTAVTPPGGTTTEVIEAFLRFISLGKLPNELLRNTITITITPAGEVVVDEDFEFDCKGSGQQ